MRRPGRASGALVVLLGIELLDELVFGAREAAWPLVRGDLGLTYAQVGLLLAVPNVVSAVVEPVVGILGDAWRRRVLVVGGGLAYAAALALTGVSGGFVSLLVAFVLLYPAAGAFVSLSQATLMDADPSGRERNMVRWTIAGALGSLAGPAAVGALAFVGLGWRPLFLALAALSLALALASSRVRPARPARRDGPRGAWRALRRRAVVRWLVLLELSDQLLDGLLGFLALYLVDEAGAARGTAALAVSLWVGAGIAGSVLVLRLLRHASGLAYLRVSAVAAAALFAAFLLAPPLPAKLAALAGLGVATAGWYPLLKARLYAELEGRSGTAMALGGVFGPLGSAGPLAVGLVAERAGLGVALWLLLIGPAALLALMPGRGCSESDPRS